jgi:hypothetical protein
MVEIFPIQSSFRKRKINEITDAQLGTYHEVGMRNALACRKEYAPDDLNICIVIVL